MAKYHMRRIEKEISNREELIEILKSGKYTIISLCKENEPYIITLSYGYDESKHALYFHCAKEGQKIDFIKANPHICGTVIEDNGYEDGCGQAFRSIVFRGKMVIVEAFDEKKKGLDILINHLEKDPNPIKNKFLKKENTYENLGMLRLDITDISGKEEKAES
ncbi:MAG: flavin-nucleotide-binding protein [Promethearchaeota archaeon]|nr:pyridoxamine 5'-phosphate oxidase family protein [Candidatus Lokiarchaeota archaeon]MCK4479398.1 pyridoxamine 5'-phosphate oxidase family protein [Candidatus Lokiarchaeota archaeon]TET60012.1 MAG: flavin-nucleotide-binding protein [Candidatus Lokiarchaeota archaeon]